MSPLRTAGAVAAVVLAIAVCVRGATPASATAVPPAAAAPAAISLDWLFGEEDENEPDEQENSDGTGGRADPDDQDDNQSAAPLLPTWLGLVALGLMLAVVTIAAVWVRRMLRRFGVWRDVVAEQSRKAWDYARDVAGGARERARR